MNPSETPTISTTLLALENAALARWCAGDPSGFLEICADEVVYFDPFLDRRLDGRAALEVYYEGLRGKVSAARFEILNPLIQIAGEVAVLTFNFVSFAETGESMRWNCTEIYRRNEPWWRIIQTHWSFTRPG